MMQGATTTLLSTAYLAPVSYYARLYHAKRVVLECHENYNKQSYRNRAFIASNQGPLALSIPVEKGAEVKCPIREVRLSDHGDWRHQHLVALMSNYGNTPFYEYYIDDLRPILEHPFTFLFDLNEALRAKICELIGFTPNVIYSDAYVEVGDDATEVRDLRNAIHPKKDFHVMEPDFVAKPYYQVHGEKVPFMENLSIVDLLFNMGPESVLVLRDSLR